MAWECVCVDAEQVEDVWACPVEECAWVEVRLDGDQDQACGVREEADAARAGPTTAGGVEDGAENLAGAMGADTEIVIDPYEYPRNNSCE